MRCKRCLREAPADAAFCPECGNPLAVPCPRCEAENAPGYKFCKQCGQPLRAAHSRQTTTSQPASPPSYTPAYLAEKILASRSALEGERKQVTVLFCDIVESSRLAAQVGPEEMHRIWIGPSEPRPMPSTGTRAR